MDSPPSNTRRQEEIEVLKAEIQNLSQKNAALMERTAIASSQVVKLELLRDGVPARWKRSHFTGS